MESKEIIASLITTAITASSIILIWLIQFFFKRLINTKNKQNELDDLTTITNYVLDAEKKLGKGQGKAKLLYVLSKLNKKENDKKAITKINNVHTTLTAAKKAIETDETMKQIENAKGE